MTTLEQINDVHSSLGTQSSMPEYLDELNKIGVLKYESFISDGHSEYHCSDGQILIGDPEHENFDVSSVTDAKKFQEHLTAHAAGKSSYEEMSKALAECGIEKWTFDTVKMTLVYADSKGIAVLTEQIE